MFYVVDDKVYILKDGKYHNVGFTAKDKVITQRELESTEVVMGTQVLDALNSAVPMTREEVIAKFHLSESNPIPVVETEKKTSRKK